MLKDKDLQDLYTIAIKNRFTELSDVNDFPTDSYDHLIKANQEAAKEYIPVKEKLKRTNYSEHPDVKSARENVQNAFQEYTKNSSKFNQEKLQKEKQLLEKTYYDLFEVDNASVKATQGESWRLINEISG